MGTFYDSRYSMSDSFVPGAGASYFRATKTRSFSTGGVSGGERKEPRSCENTAIGFHVDELFLLHASERTAFSNSSTDPKAEAVGQL